MSEDRNDDIRGLMSKIVQLSAKQAPKGKKKIITESSEPTLKTIFENLTPKVPTDADRIWKSVQPDGSIIWYKGDKKHRDDDLPAVEYQSGIKYWYQNGKIHRDNGPAAVVPTDAYHVGKESYYHHGKRHREDGPAVVYGDGRDGSGRNGRKRAGQGSPNEYWKYGKRSYAPGELAEAVQPGQKPLPVMTNNKPTGQGFVSSTNPAVQNMLKNLDPKDVQIVMPDNKPGTLPNQQVQPNRNAPNQNNQNNQTGAVPLRGGATTTKAGAINEVIDDEELTHITDNKGNQHWFNSKQQHHRTDGPAFIDNKGKEYWFTNGKRTEAPAKVDEADMPSVSGIDNMGAGLGAGRSQTTLEAKSTKENTKMKEPTKLSPKAPGSFVKKMDNKAEKSGKKVTKDIEYDEKVKDKISGAVRGKEDTKAERAGKKVTKDIEFDRKKKKQLVKENMNNRIQAARLEGKAHALKGQSHAGSNYEDPEEAKAYHAGFKSGLDERFLHQFDDSYSMMEDERATVPGMANQEMDGLDEIMLFGDDNIVDESIYDEHPTINYQHPDFRTPENANANPKIDRYGTKFYFNKEGRYHRDDGPAKEWEDGTQEYYINGQLHNDNGPAFRGSDGTEAYYKNGKRHRIGGPAQTDEYGAYHYKDGLRHNDDGPAVIDPQGNKYWMKNDMLHRIGGPAIEYADGRKAWYQNDKKLSRFSMKKEKLKPYTPPNGDVDESTIKADPVMESWDNQLTALLNEGISVSINKNTPNVPDSVSVTASDHDAEQLLDLVKNAGLGIFSEEEVDPMAGGFVPEPTNGDEPEVAGEIEVVGDNDDMLGIMKRLSGIQGDEVDSDDDDDAGETYDSDSTDVGPAEEDSTESELAEVETDDQREFQVAEDNLPDSGAAETDIEEKDSAQANASDAEFDDGEDDEQAASDISENKGSNDFYSVIDPIADELAKKFNLRVYRDSEGSGLQVIGLEGKTDSVDISAEVKPGIFSTNGKTVYKVGSTLDGDEDQKFNNFDDAKLYFAKQVEKLYPYLDGKEMNLDETQEDPGEVAEYKMWRKANFDDKKTTDEIIDKPVSPTRFPGEELTEWANDVGKNGTDESFQQDIDFMTKIISGGLNKQKSTGQTTEPVLASQKSRQGQQVNESVETPSDWAKLAGIFKR